METDQPNTENPDQGTSDEQVASQARSYECTFCKRGFSNAQALGGHMNIHRKDKAKLKQTSNDQHQQSLDIPKIAPSYSPIPMNTKHALMEAKSGEERSNIHWPWILGNKEGDATKRDETTRVGEVRQLPLFVEKPSSGDQNPSSQVHRNTEKGLSSSHGSSSLELDLELRLGPEPQDSSAVTGTKKYF